MWAVLKGEGYPVAHNPACIMPMQAVQATAKVGTTERFGTIHFLWLCYVLAGRSFARADAGSAVRIHPSNHCGHDSRVRMCTDNIHCSCSRPEKPFRSFDGRYDHPSSFARGPYNSI
jgi:hypothetical protein